MDFSIIKPSSFWATPMAMETPMATALPGPTCVDQRWLQLLEQRLGVAVAAASQLRAQDAIVAQHQSGRVAMATDGHLVARGFHSHGGTLEGWFISWKSPLKFDDLGVPPF